MLRPGVKNGRRPWARVIIVNYNAGSMLQACVDALAAQTMADFEAIIVDNASTDGSAETVLLPDARFSVMEAGANLGFAAANNLGAKGCSPPWIATLNPDTVPEPSWLDEMRRGTERYPAACMFGATLLDAANPSMVDGFGDALSIAGIPWRGLVGRPATDLPDRDAEVFAPCAAAALYARESFERAGGFDEMFFCYIEDLDLAFRLRLDGERCMQLRHAIVHHHGSASTGRASEFTIFHSFRNRLWLIWKDMPFALAVIALPANIICSLLMLARIPPRLPVRAALRGVWSGVAPPVDLFAKRRKVQSGRRISVARIGQSLWWDLRKLRAKPAGMTSDPSVGRGCRKPTTSAL